MSRLASSAPAWGAVQSWFDSSREMAYSITAASGEPGRPDTAGRLPGSVVWIITATLGLLVSSSSVLLWGDPQYQTNDDVMMGLIADGSVSGSPSDELVFVNRIIGNVLTSLYRVAPSVGWYAWALLATTILALLVMAGMVSRSSLWVKFLWVAFALPTVIFLTQRPSFTATAILACAVGLSVLAVGPPNWKWTVTGSVLIITGVLWRENGLVAAGLASSAIIVFSLITSGWRRLLLLIGVPMGALVLASLGQKCWNLALNGCSAWTDYLAYNAARGALHGTPRDRVIQPLVGSDIGWGPYTTELFRIFGYFDDPTFFEPVIRANSSIPIVLNIEGGSLLSHLLMVTQAMTFFAPLLIVWSLIAVLGAWLTTSTQEAWRRTAVIAGALVVTMLTGSVIALVRLPTPVAVGLALAFATQSVAISSRNRDTTRLPAFANALTLLLALGVMLFVIAGPNGVTVAGAANRVNQETNARVISELLGVDAPILGGGWMTHFFASNPYGATPPSVRSTLPLLSGWLVFSPDWLRQKEKLGIRDTYVELLTSTADMRSPSKIPLFMGNELLAEVTAAFMSEELGLSRVVTPIPVVELGAGVSLWTMVGSN